MRFAQHALLNIVRGLSLPFRPLYVPMGRDFEQIRQSLATNIKELRGNQGLSQEALALGAGVDRTYVSQIERGVGNPSLLILSKLGNVLDVDVQDLIGC